MAGNAELARRLHEAWNERAFDEMAEATAADSTITVIGSGATFEGKEGGRAYNEMWADGFPDGKVTVDRVIDGGDYVVVEFTGTGTHTGTLKTSMGDIPATGRSMTLQLCDVMEFKDGKVQSQKTYFDTGSMMAQLGLMPEQTASQQK
ncbi:MAG TPA: nuclear transport factor 2 family protein [Marmoricola sp.]|nr:nuclear transport factor 2 family protein [Marmoricola sp.]